MLGADTCPQPSPGVPATPMATSSLDVPDVPEGQPATADVRPATPEASGAIEPSRLTHVPSTEGQPQADTEVCPLPCEPWVLCLCSRSSFNNTTFSMQSYTPRAHFHASLTIPVLPMACPQAPFLPSIPRFFLAFHPLSQRTLHPSLIHLMHWITGERRSLKSPRATQGWRCSKVPGASLSWLFPPHKVRAMPTPSIASARSEWRHLCIAWGCRG